MMWFVASPVDEEVVDVWPLLRPLWGEWVPVLLPDLPQWGTKAVSNSHIFIYSIKAQRLRCVVFLCLCWCDCLLLLSPFVKTESWCPLLPGRAIPPGVTDTSAVKTKFKACNLFECALCTGVFLVRLCVWSGKDFLGVCKHFSLWYSSWSKLFYTAKFLVSD